MGRTQTWRPDLSGSQFQSNSIWNAQPRGPDQKYQKLIPREVLHRLPKAGSWKVYGTATVRFCVTGSVCIYVVVKGGSKSAQNNSDVFAGKMLEHLKIDTLWVSSSISGARPFWATTDTTGRTPRRCLIIDAQRNAGIHLHLFLLCLLWPWLVCGEHHSTPAIFNV